MQSLGGHRLRSFAHAARASVLAGLASLASCGGSSSETPPPLEPLPVNVHYNRSATTLPGELGTSLKAPREDPSALPVEPAASARPAPPERRPLAPSK